jgi:uncharacterized Zn-finger protein
MHYNRKHYLRHSCQDCDKSFGLRKDLERHEKSVHKKHGSPVPTISCANKRCRTPGKKFTRYDNFLRHRKLCGERSLRAAMAGDI